MAGERTVKIKFSGETKDLDRAAGNVRKSLDKTSDGFDRAGEAADNLDTKAMGFRDTMTGVQDTMKGTSLIAKGDLFQGFFTLGMGLGDLGSGLYNFVIPAFKAMSIQMIKNATTAVTSAARVVAGWVLMGINAMRQAAVMAAAWLISLGPVALIIAAIAAVVAIFVVLWLKSSAFRDFFIGLWNKIWGFLKGVGAWFAGPFKNFFVNAWNRIKDGASGVYNWIRDKLNAVVSFVKGIPGRISSAASGMWDGVKNAFRSAINWVIRKWNDFHISIPGVDTHIPGVGKIGGFTLSTPNLPLLDVGGRILETGLAVVHKGETVTPARTAPLGDQVIELHVDLGEGIQRVFQVKLSEHDRGMRRRALAGVTR